jgi:hypothetical protein
MRNVVSSSILVILVLTLAGCGGGGTSSQAVFEHNGSGAAVGAPTPGADGGPPSTPATSASTAEVVLQSSAAKTVTELRVTGLDLAGHAVYPTRTFAFAPELHLTVPLDLVHLRVEYLSGGEVTAMSVPKVALTPGATVLVSNPPRLDPATLIASLDVTPAAPRLAAGTATPMGATVRLSDGTVQDATGSVTWSVGDSSIATVSNQGGTRGLLAARAVGSTRVSAAIGSVTGDVPLTVTSATLSAVTVTPALPAMALGTTLQLAATGTFSDGSHQDLTAQSQWSADGPVVSVDASGLASANAVGAASVTATVLGRSGSTSLAVSDALLQRIDIEPAGPSLAKGTTLPLVATGTFSDGTTQDLTSSVVWATQGGNAAVSNASGSRGLLSGLTVGADTVTATRGAVSGSAAVAITAATLQSISITPFESSIPLGLTGQFTATGLFSDGSTQDLTGQATWTGGAGLPVSNAPRGQAQATAVGSATVTATVGAVSGSTVARVLPAALAALSISPPTPSLARGTGLQLVALGSFTDGSSADLTSQASWSVDANATVSNAAGSQGLVTATALGAAHVTATLRGVSGSATVTVTAATLTAIGVTPAVPSLPLGTTRQMTATGVFSDGTTQDLTATASWTTDQAGVAAISASGLATSVGVGDATLTATMGPVSGSTLVHVTAAALKTLSVTSSAPTVPLGRTVSLTAIGTYTDGSTADVTTQATWTVDAHASVSNAAGTNGQATGTSAGTATFTASLDSVNGSASVEVTAAVLESIQVTPIVPVVPIGFTQQFTATGVYSDGTTQDLTSSVVWGGDVSAQGLLTAALAGPAVATATLGAVSGSTTAHVTSAALTAIQVTPANPAAARGTSVQMIATGTFSDGTTADISSQVTWSAGPNATISNAAGSRGLATAATVGTATLTATRGAVSGSTDLTISSATLQSIVVTPNVPVLGIGQVVQMTAMGVFSDGTTQDLTGTASWSTSGAASVSPTGQVTALSVGQTDVTATVGGVSASTPVHVTDAVLVTIAVTPPSGSIPKGTSRDYTATGTFSDGTSRDLTTRVTWTSSGGAVSISNTAPDQGRATGTTPGSVTVTARMGAVSGTADLTVSAAQLTSVTVTPYNPNLPIGASVTCNATAGFSDGSTLDVTGSASWTSLDNSVATVAAGGVTTGVAVGQTSIRATYLGVSGTTPVTVTDAALASIAVTPAGPTVVKGTTRQLTATGTFTDGSTADLTTTVTWSSGSGNAPVSNLAGSKGVVTGSGVGGPVAITATLRGISGNTGVSVTTATLVRVDVTPVEPVLPIGAVQAMVATAVYSDGTTQDVSATAVWTSSAPSIATVNASGSVNPLALGGTTVTATFGGRSGNTVVDVIDARLTAITVTPTGVNLPVGATRAYTATGTYTDGVARDITSRVTWSSSVPGRATVSNAAGSRGVATAIAGGAVTVTATLEGVSGSTGLTVSAATLVSIAITPFQPILPKGSVFQMTATGTYTDGSTADITGTAAWSSSSGNATVSNTSGSKGRVTGVTLGQATITATQAGISGTMAVATTDAALVSIAITSGAGGAPNVAKNSSRQLVAIGTYTDGSTLNLTSASTWTSLSPSVITVNSTSPNRGLATAVGVGSAVLHADYGGVTGAATATVSESTDLIDVGSGGFAANSSASVPRISGDGTRIAYHSTATDLVAGDTNGFDDIFVRTGVGGATPTTIRVSVADATLANVQANSQSLDCAISANGDFVVFSSFASNLTPGFLGAVGNAQHVFRRQISTNQTILVDENRNTTSSESCFAPAVSADGRYVVFRTGNSNLYGGAINQQHIVRADTTLGTFALADALFASLNLSGNPDISADGDWVCYETLGSLGTIGFTDNSSQEDIVLKQMSTGTSFLVSHIPSSSTTAASGTGSFPVGSTNSAISGDGRYVAFQSDSLNVVNGDTNGKIDVFRYDRTTTTNIRVSVPDPSTGNTQGDGDSTNPRISADGRYVIFISSSANLVNGDTNGAADVFIHDCVNNTTQRVSVDPVGLQCNGSNFTPDIDDLGDVLTFMTRAPNLDTRIQNGFDHIIKAIYPPPVP